MEGVSINDVMTGSPNPEFRCSRPRICRDRKCATLSPVSETVPATPSLGFGRLPFLNAVGSCPLLMHQLDGFVASAATRR